MKRIEDYEYSLNIQAMQILNDSLDEHAYSLIIHCTCARSIWKTLCAHFDGTNDGESCSKKLVEIYEEEVSTSGRKLEESIHEEHEENHLCLVGHEQEVSNSNSNNGEFSFEELQDAFHELQ